MDLSLLNGIYTLMPATLCQDALRNISNISHLSLLSPIKINFCCKLLHR